MARINSPTSGTTRAMICFLAVVAVGKERIVGDIDLVRVRPGADDLTQDREAAGAGIGDRMVGGADTYVTLADLRLRLSCFDGAGAPVFAGWPLADAKFGMIQIALARPESYDSGS